MDFARSFREFLSQEGIECRCDGDSFHFDNGLTVVLVRAGSDAGVRPAVQHAIHLYEDRWRCRPELVKARILAHLGRQKTVFARKCEVVKLSAQEAAAFLTQNHIYGTARCKYRYGLRFGGMLVAVSTFSASRPITRLIAGEERVVDSYEWVRFASLPQYRIVGGMGRLLKAFEEDVHPQDIMSYADREWSAGAVYERLGFHKTGEVPPVWFLVDPLTWQRISVKKVQNDRACRGIGLSDAGYYRIANLGSIKYVRTLCTES